VPSLGRFAGCRGPRKGGGGSLAGGAREDSSDRGHACAGVRHKWTRVSPRNWLPVACADGQCGACWVRARHTGGLSCRITRGASRMRNPSECLGLRTRGTRPRRSWDSACREWRLCCGPCHKTRRAQHAGPRYRAHRADAPRATSETPRRFFSVPARQGWRTIGQARCPVARAQTAVRTGPEGHAPHPPGRRAIPAGPSRHTRGAVAPYPRGRRANLAAPPRPGDERVVPIVGAPTAERVTGASGAPVTRDSVAFVG
jgi:hypothetical protein